MRNTLFSTSSTPALHNPTSAKKKVITTYWPWMRTMRLLEDARLGRRSWADARFTYITDPRPYENLLTHAPKMIRTSNTAPATLAAVSDIKSIYYRPALTEYSPALTEYSPALTEHSPALTQGNETWPWEQEMRLKEDLRLRKKGVTWGQVRWLWLSESN